jgi:non-canonical purine NTP pyrophosphatase (RdgB/HAM1 family)
MVITFVTTNKGKIASLKRKLSPRFQVRSIALVDLPELQANSSAEIVVHKAKAAYSIIRRPLLVQDSSFHINALKGFPGAYIKYVLETLKPKGILQLMEGETDRTCYFEDSIGYTEDGKAVNVFTSTNPGRVSLNIDKANNSKSWSDVWKIFIPEGSTKTLSALSQKEYEELKKVNSNKSSCFSEFAKYLEEVT